MAFISSAVLQMRKIDGIIVSVTNYTYTPGNVSLKKTMTPKQYRDFQIYMADALCDEFVRAIDTQRYKSGSHAWKPLNIKYYTWKKKHNLSLNIWEATGLMKKSLHVFKKGNFICVGFKQSDVYPKSGAKINQIARYLEFGGRKVPRPPSRPLFRPITLYMRKNVDRYYARYQKELKRTGKKYIYL